MFIFAEYEIPGNQTVVAGYFTGLFVQHGLSSGTGYKNKSTTGQNAV